MPQHIQYIDKICREKNRDVLYLKFDRQAFNTPDWNYWQSRKIIIEWLEKNYINHFPCGDVANENFFPSYNGQIYIDVPYDENDANYQKLRNYLEDINGHCKIEGVIFCYLPYEHAMKNKHHDEVDFCEELIEKF
jgi:hypothetical protein